MLTTAILSIGLAVSIQAGGADVPELHQFDFWVGDWKLTGELHTPNGVVKTDATNSIHKILDGKILQENFHSAGTTGMSVSAYNPQLKTWRQTWVDNGGNYISLNGGFKDGKMVLSTQPGPKGGVYRMVFRDIKADSFDWDWELKKPGEKDWTLQWHLHYERAAL